MTVDLQFPTCWEEVNARQLKIIAKALALKMPRNTTLIYLLCHLAGIRVVYSSSRNKDGKYLFSLRKFPYRIFSMGADVVAAACKQLEYILDTIGLPECPLPGVNRCLYDVPFDAYYTANALYTAYTTNGEQSYLLEGARLLSGSKQPKKLMAAYALWFTGLQHYFKEEYPNIFSEGEESSSSPAKQLHDLLSILNKDEPQMDRQILTADTHSVLRALDNKLLKLKQK